ncbi:MAG: hypothetical protein ROR55_07120 [Devosia sp.]
MGLRTLIGIVGYTPVLEVFPLGPHLMTALNEAVADTAVTVENMTWGPIHIVQRFQEPDAERFARVVLVGAGSSAPQPGKVRAFRWAGGTMDEETLQERIYEGITGVVDIENTLVIGGHFGVWPAETYTVEADLPADAFGRMVIADSEGWADDAALTAHLGFSPLAMRSTLAQTAAAIALHGDKADTTITEKSVATFTPVVPFIRNHTVVRPSGGT